MSHPIQVLFHGREFLARSFALGACFTFVRQYGNDKILFVGLPAWFFAAVLYLVLSKLYQQKVDA